jgi:3-dehydroquinate synthase
MVVFFSDIEALNELLRNVTGEYSSVFVLCDDNTIRHCLPLINEVLPSGHKIIIIPSGEKNKNLDTCSLIWQELTDAAADRRSLLINLGGGVICDMGGFAASCYKRGIDFVNIPTTLLAMADASVGGKTGIDFNQYKNQIGLFSEPKETLICDGFLKTLDERQIRSGLAEIVKHYLIADEESFMQFAETDPSVYMHPGMAMIRRAVDIKSGIVALDPLEKNARKKLNFGHTIGHALESYTMASPQPLLHGEAIAFGMAIEVFIAAFQGLIDDKKAELVCYVLYSTFGLQPMPEEWATSIIDIAGQDKKNDKGIIKMALIDAIGSCQIDIAVHTEDIKKAILYFNKSINWYNR